MARKRWTAQEKQAVVLEGLRGVRTVVDVCREHGVTQDQFFRWRDRFVEGGRRALARPDEAPRSSEGRPAGGAEPDAAHPLERTIRLQAAAVRRLARLLHARTTTDE